jgi:hypothetical protein
MRGGKIAGEALTANDRPPMELRAFKRRYARQPRCLIHALDLRG